MYATRLELEPAQKIFQGREDQKGHYLVYVVYEQAEKSRISTIQASVHLSEFYPKL